MICIVFGMAFGRKKLYNDRGIKLLRLEWKLAGLLACERYLIGECITWFNSDCHMQILVTRMQLVTFLTNATLSLSDIQVPLDKIEFPLINGLEVEKVPFTIFKLVDVLLETISTSDCSNRATVPYLTFFHNLLMEPIKEELTGYDTILVIPVQVHL